MPAAEVPIAVVFGAFSVPATVTPPGDPAIATAIVWIQPQTLDFPGASDFSRREWRRVAALRLDEVPTVPKGTLIQAPELAGGPLRTWRVDDIEQIEADHLRVVVVEED